VLEHRLQHVRVLEHDSQHHAQLIDHVQRRLLESHVRCRFVGYDSVAAMNTVEHFRAGVAVGLAVLALRAFPVLVALFVRSDFGGLQKLISFVAYTLVACVAVAFSVLDALNLSVAYAYLLVASVVAYFLVPRLPAGVAFLFLLALFLLVPALAIPEPLVVLLLGWEAALAVYSYCRDAPEKSRTLPDYWFFVFVNPTVAYPARGVRVSAPVVHLGGLARTARGVATLVLSGMAGSVAASIAAVGIRFGEPLLLALRLIGLYAAHVGLASVQIGLFRQLGYDAPERYRQPYRATTPRDFWARWNTYLGCWVRFYVFEPTVRFLSPRLRSLPKHRRAILRTTTIVTSFFFMGAFHDVYAIAVTKQFAFEQTAWFVANGVVIVLWDAVASLTRARTRPWVASMAAVATMLSLVAALGMALPRS
jgi:hypothetical protein